MRRITSREELLSNSATDVSAGIRVTDYRNCILSLRGSNNANLKVFVKGAVGDVGPSSWSGLTSNRSNSGNWWEYIEVIDLEDGAAIDGTVGINLSGNVVRLIEVNINSLDWLAVHVTAVVAGTISIVGVFTDNK